MSKLAGEVAQVWQRMAQFMPQPQHKVVSTAYPVRRTIPKVLNRLMRTLVQCFRQMLWMVTRQLQATSQQWQATVLEHPDSMPRPENSESESLGALA
jgi:hypothetical protein